MKFTGRVLIADPAGTIEAGVQSRDGGFEIAAFFLRFGFMKVGIQIVGIRSNGPIVIFNRPAMFAETCVFLRDGI